MNFIKQLENHLSSLLQEEPQIKDNIKNIYFLAPKRGELPFLLININNYEALREETNQNLYENLYKVTLSIELFHYKNCINKLYDLSEIVKNILDTKMPDYKITDNVKSYHIIGVKFNRIMTHRSKDLEQMKIELNYQFLISTQ